MKNKKIGFNFAVIICLFFLISNTYAYSVDWEVGNRFRAFDYLSKDNNTTKSKELFDEYAPDEKISISEWMSGRVKSGKTSLSPYSKNNRGPWTEESLTEINTKSGYQKDFVKLPVYVYLTVTLLKDSNNSPPNETCDIYLNKKKIKSENCSNKIVIENYPSQGALIQFIASGKLIFETNDIKPKLKIILGLGDSYAAGEGAPDVPTKWENNINTKEWPIGDLNRNVIQRYVKNPAEWYSDKCNRSYFSSQSLTAIKLARDEPHSVVSFVHLACAGAEVVDGILAPQRNAPGLSGDGCSTRKLETIQTPRKECDVHFSQLEAATRLLCKGEIKFINQSPVLAKLKAVGTHKYQTEWIQKIPVCENENFIKPNLIMLQIGGNDIGFSRIIAWALIPSKYRNKFGKVVVGLARSGGGVVCPDENSLDCDMKERNAKLQMKDLPFRYLALKEAFNLSGIGSQTLLISGYTNPMYRQDNKLCVNDGGLHKNEWWLTKTLIPSGVKPSIWEFNLVDYDTKEVNNKVIPNLNMQVKASADNTSSALKNWLYVDQSNVMNGKGWCVDKTDSLPSLNIKPNNVYKWNAFEDRGRYIRTSNDSVMTQWRKYDKFDFIAGSFHPNVQGHAAIADELYNSIKNNKLWN